MGPHEIGYACNHRILDPFSGSRSCHKRVEKQTQKGIIYWHLGKKAVIQTTPEPQQPLRGRKLNEQGVGWSHVMSWTSEVGTFHNKGLKLHYTVVLLENASMYLIEVATAPPSSLSHYVCSVSFRLLA